MMYFVIHLDLFGDTLVEKHVINHSIYKEVQNTAIKSDLSRYTIIVFQNCSFFMILWVFHKIKDIYIFNRGFSGVGIIFYVIRCFHKFFPTIFKSRARIIIIRRPFSSSYFYYLLIWFQFLFPQLPIIRSLKKKKCHF